MGSCLGGIKEMGYCLHAVGSSRAPEIQGEWLWAGPGWQEPRGSSMELSSEFWIWKLLPCVPFVSRETQLLFNEKKKKSKNSRKSLCSVTVFSFRPALEGTESSLTAKTKGATWWTVRNGWAGEGLQPFVSLGSGQGCREFDTAEMIISRGCFWGKSAVGEAILALPGFDSMSCWMDALFCFQILTSHKG